MPNQPPTPPPSDGFFGWLGRQVGHVKKAVKTPGGANPDAPDQPAAPAAQSTEDRDAPAGDGGGPKVIYREDRVEEADLPDKPGVKLRRTVIDEVIVDREDDARRPT